MTAPVEMLTVAEAREAILERFASLEPETVLLLDAVDRVLTERIEADVDLPPFDNSSMDGYAVRALDIAGATRERPVRLRVVADVAAGHPTGVMLEPGTAARITTGAPLPRGADAVVPVEATDDPSRGASQLRSEIAIFQEARSGAHVRHPGEDVRRGQVVLDRGALIRYAEVAMLAAVGRASVRVVRRPRVALFATGDELVAPDERPGPGQIRNANELGTAAQVLRYGGVPVLLGIARDAEADVREKFEEALAQRADLIVTSAGVSVGAHDVVKDVVRAHGEIALWRIRMRPGKPLAFGHYKSTPFFGLPGNPVSAMLTFEQFVRPVLLKMGGRIHLDKPTVQVRLLEAVESDGRETYARAWVERDGPGYVARLSGDQGSNVLSALAGANALLIVPEGVTRLEAGSRAWAQMLYWPEGDVCG
ncbi:MAG TPA: gephyrin-like molybdotransferase Glp [Anaerolineae bacterium]|nr:gephyrin-like molybdotransferase Glp [Anaerolineae bacterium]